MKALFINGIKTLAVREVDTPICAANEELVNVEIAGIGGSEYLAYANPGIRPLPSIMSHGFSGVTNDGERVTVNPLLSCGVCRYCAHGLSQLCDSWSLIGVQSNGGFAEKAAVPTKNIIKLPAALNWEQAVFIEPFANSINAWEVSSAVSSSKIGIIGAGSLGLGLIACANKHGCKTIAVADHSFQRLEAASQLGATAISQSIKPEKYDVVFDTVGSSDARQTAFQSAKKGGTVVLLGFATAIFEIDASELIRYQKKLIGSFVFSEKQFSSAIDLVSIVDINWVENLSFHQVETRLNEHLNGDFSVVKSALRPSKM